MNKPWQVFLRVGSELIEIARFKTRQQAERCVTLREWLYQESCELRHV